MNLRMYRYRIYPSRKQQRRLFNNLEVCKQVYNELLKLSIKTYKATGKALSRYDFNNYLKGRYKGSIHSQVIQNVSDRVHKAFRNFFRKLEEKKRGKKVKFGFPRFKKFYKSITYPQNNGSFKFRNERRLCVSRIGSIPIVKHREIEGKIKNLTIKRNPAGQWLLVLVAK